MPLSSLETGSIYASLFPHFFALLRSKHNYLSLLQHQRALLKSDLPKICVCHVLGYVLSIAHACLLTGGDWWQK